MADEQVPGITAESPEWEKAEPLYKTAYPDLDSGYMKKSYNSARSQKIIEQNEGNRLKGVGGDYTPMRPWEEMKEHYQNVYPDLDSDQMGQQYEVARKLHSARRQMYMAHPDTLGETIARNLSGLGSKIAGRSATDPSWIRIKSGRGTDEDYRNVASYETMGINQEAQAKTLAGSAGQAIIAAPEQVSQFMLGRRMLPEAEKAGALAQAGLGALSTLANPVQFLHGAAERAKAQGGEIYSPQNLIPAATQTALSNAVMGSVSHWASGIKNPVARYAAAVAGGTAEMQIPKEALALLDEVLPESYKTHTKYGIAGSLLNDEGTDEALREATKDAIVMTVLHGFSGNKYKPRKLMEKAQEAAVEAKKQGLSDQEAVAASHEAMNRHVDEYKTREQLPKDAANRPEGWDENVKQMVGEGFSYEEATKEADGAHGLETQATLPAEVTGERRPDDSGRPTVSVDAGPAAAPAREAGGVAEAMPPPGAPKEPSAAGAEENLHPLVREKITLGHTPEEAVVAAQNEAKAKGLPPPEAPSKVGLKKKPYAKEIGENKAKFEEQRPRFEELNKNLSDLANQLEDARKEAAENPSSESEKDISDIQEKMTASKKEVDSILASAGIEGRHRDIFDREAAGQTHAEIASETGIPRSTVGDLSRRWREILGAPAAEETQNISKEMGLREGKEKYGDVEERLPETEKLGLKKKLSPIDQASNKLEKLTNDWMRESQRKRPDAAKLRDIEDQLNQANAEYAGHWKNEAEDLENAIHDDHTRRTGKRGAEQQASIRRDIADDVQKSDTLREALTALQGDSGEAATAHAEAQAADAVQQAPRYGVDAEDPRAPIRQQMISEMMQQGYSREAAEAYQLKNETDNLKFKQKAAYGELKRRGASQKELNDSWQQWQKEIDRLPDIYKPKETATPKQAEKPQQDFDEQKKFIMDNMNGNEEDIERDVKAVLSKGDKSSRYRKIDSITSSMENANEGERQGWKNPRTGGWLDPAHEYGDLLEKAVKLDEAKAAGDVQKSDTLREALTALQGDSGEAATAHPETQAADALRSAAGNRVRPGDIHMGDSRPTKEGLQNRLNSVVRGMHPDLLKDLKDTGRGFKIHEGHEEVTDAFRDVGGKVSPGKHIRAFAVTYTDGRTEYHFSKETSAWTVAHELGHGTDKLGDYSDSNEFRSIYHEELADGQLSEYASSKRNGVHQYNEGFAEFFALLHDGGFTDDLEANFPKMSQFFKDNGLWPQSEKRLPGSLELTRGVVNADRGDIARVKALTQAKEDTGGLISKARELLSNLRRSREGSPAVSAEEASGAQGEAGRRPGEGEQEAERGAAEDRAGIGEGAAASAQERFQSGEPSPAAQRAIGDAVKQHLTDFIGADEGSLNTDYWKQKAREVGKDLTKAYHGFFDHIRNLGSEAFPGLERASGEVANAAMRLLSSGRYVKAKTAELAQKLFPPNMTEQQRSEWGSAFNEERYRHARQANLDAAKRASNDAAAARVAGDKDAAKEAAKKATEFIIAARKVPTNVEGTRGTGGQPARLLRNTGLRDEQHFQQILQDPAYQKAMQGWAREVTPEANRNYADAQGMDYSDPIDSVTQLPDRVQHAKRTGLEDQITSPGTLGLKESSRGRLGNQKLSKYKYAKGASFEGDMYENDIGKILENSLSGVQQANKAKFYRTLQEEGIGAWGSKGQFANDYEKITDVNPPRDTQEAKSRGIDPGTGEYQKDETEFFVKKEHANDVKKALGLKEPNKIGAFLDKITGAFTQSSVMSTIEPSYHGVNQMAKLFRVGNPFMNIGRLVKGMYDYATSDPEFLRHVSEIAKIGATKDFHDIPQRGAADPRQIADLSSRFLRMMDLASRVALDKAYMDAAQGKGVQGWFGKLEFSEENRRNFINSGAGLYDKRAQHGLIAFLRDAGLGPFATWGFNAPIQAVAGITGSPGGRAASMKDAIGLRAFQLSKIAAVAVVPLVVNYMVHGDPLGDDNTPLFAFKLGDDGKGKTSYFDPLKYLGIRKGYNLLAGAMEDWMRRDKSVGKSIDKQQDEMLKTLIHPFAGPMPDFAYTVATGKDSLGRQVAEPAGEDESQKWNNFKAAVKQANPSVGAVAGEWATPGELGSKLTGFYGYSKRNPPEVSNFYDTLRSAEDRFKAESKKASDQGLRAKEPRELTVLQQSAKRIHEIQLRMNGPETSPEDFKKLRAAQAEIAKAALQAHKEIRTSSLQR